MSITGQINLVTNPTAFFGQVLTGAKKPATGFEPAKSGGFSVILLGNLPGPVPAPVSAPATVNAATGGFAFPTLPTPAQGFGPGDMVSLHVTSHNTPFYRSAPFPLSHADAGLDIFVYQPVIPASDGISAGLISKGLTGQSLPPDTKLTANPWGIGVAGDQSGADVQFGISLVPDQSSNLSLFFDMQLHNWNIHVGFPADCKYSADGILATIKSALQTSGSAANALAATTIAKAFEGPPLNLPATITAQLLAAISIQFMSLPLPNAHTWPLANTTDPTIVITPQLALGFPRAF